MEDFDNAKTRNPRECVVTNLNSYLTYISDIKETIKKEEGAEVSTKHYFFRGQASNEWNVMPGVFRGGMLPHEAELINAAYTRNPDDFRKLTTDFEKLAKLQHYGLPTRLLDVTENPLVIQMFQMIKWTRLFEKHCIMLCIQKFLMIVMLQFKRI